MWDTGVGHQPAATLHGQDMADSSLGSLPCGELEVHEQGRQILGQEGFSQSGVWQEQPYCASPQGPLPMSEWAGSIMVPARLSSSPAQTLLTPRTGSAQPQNHRLLSSHFPQDWISSAPLRIRSPQFLHDRVFSDTPRTASPQHPPSTGSP